jgi:hypothetical protein
MRMSRTMMVWMVFAVASVLVPTAAEAHCDALDGPVVQAARAALEQRDAAPVLMWVNAEDESAVRAAFDRTLAVRKLGADAQALADTWFFETVVRLHRAGEGAGFDGLKPAGQIEPFIAAIDRTIATGSADGLLDKVAAHVRQGVSERFARARDAREHAGDSVEAGRRFVAAYVEYVHYVEALHRAANGEDLGHRAVEAGHGHGGGQP